MISRFGAATSLTRTFAIPPPSVLPAANATVSAAINLFCSRLVK